MFSEDKSIVEVDYEDILPSSYLDYSVSVIVDRAVPDLLDGLKPVQRRILYSMYESKFLHDRPYVKTAKVSGNVCGEYHPHGDSGVNTAIATMTQAFKKPVPFIDGQGNWGSVEGDSPAAARYTECRLTEFSEEVMLGLLDENAVDFQPNYDNTLKEPTVLPSKVPAVLITGAEGIAVGMRTNIPTFNLKEVIDANVYVLTHSKFSVDDILKLMPSPDFASGGVVCNPSDMRSLYLTGEGKVRIRGKVSFVPAESSKGRDKLVVEEVPYTMVGSSMISFMQNVVDLIESGYLPDVVDVVDQTTDKVRIVLELSKSADVEYVKSVLFARTKLEDAFSCNFLVVDNGVPSTLGLCELLKRFCEFQKSLYRRKYKFELDKNAKRKAVLEAYQTCCNDVDNVARIVKSSRTVSEARQKLYEVYKFTEDQANAVLSLKIQRLVGMEEGKVSKELKQVSNAIDECESVLSDEKKLVRRVVSDLKRISKKYGYERRTDVANVPVASVSRKKKKEKEVCVLVDRFAYVHSIDSSICERNRKAVENDFSFNVTCSTSDKVRFFCSDGTVFSVKASSIPQQPLRGKGTTLDSLTSGKFNSSENSVIFASSEFDRVVCVTAKGKCKQIRKEDFATSRTASTYYPVENDEVVFCSEADKQYAEVRTSEGRCLKIDVESVPCRRRSSKGVPCVRFKDKSLGKVVDVTLTGNSENVQALGWYGLTTNK